jgi:hypothetical protein
VHCVGNGRPARSVGRRFYRKAKVTRRTVLR